VGLAWPGLTHWSRRYLANEELIDFIENGVKQNGMIITKVRAGTRQREAVYRVLTGADTSPLPQIENVLKAELVVEFEAAWAELRQKRSEDLARPSMAYHGTAEVRSALIDRTHTHAHTRTTAHAHTCHRTRISSSSSLHDNHQHGQQNIESILDKGLLVPGKGKGKDVGHATDTGFWGGGIYLSPNSSMSVGYCRGTLDNRMHAPCPRTRGDGLSRLHNAPEQEGRSC
jgi:hypothetical protein